MRTTLLALPLLAFALLGADAPKEVKSARPSDGSHWQKAYPSAKAGYRRVVIHLEAKPDEDDWRVELMVGKVMETDGVNRVGLMGRLEEKTVEGWGYTYLEAPVSDGAFSTKIGVPPGAEFALMFVFAAVIYTAIKPFGAEAQAGYGIGSRLMQSLFLPAMAVAFSAAPMAGQNMGAGHLDRVREAARPVLAALT
jgi:serine protease inhibitor ecotin